MQLNDLLTGTSVKIHDLMGNLHTNGELNYLSFIIKYNISSMISTDLYPLCYAYIPFQELYVIL